MVIRSLRCVKDAEPEPRKRLPPEQVGEPTTFAERWLTLDKTAEPGLKLGFLGIKVKAIDQLRYLAGGGRLGPIADQAQLFPSRDRRNVNRLNPRFHQFIVFH